MTKEEREKRIDELLESIKNRLTNIVEDTKEMILEEQEERKALVKRLETWEHYMARNNK
jgi:hypothetical protein